MAQHADLLNQLRREVVEAPSSLLTDELKAAAIDFCVRSRCWKERVTVNLKQGNPSARVRIPYEGRVEEIEQAFIQRGETAYSLKKVRLSDLAPGLRSGVPARYAESNSHGLHVDPAPQEDMSMVIDVVAAPAWSSTTLPDFIVDRYRDALLDGARSRLLIHSNKPWTNPNLAVEYERRYMTEINEARRLATTGGFANQRLNLRKFA